MLTGPVPGTDVVVGMSRRLFAACSSLAAEQAQLLSVFRADLPDMAGTIAKESMDEEEVEAFLRERRAAFAEREVGVEDQLRGATRRAYEFGRGSSWQQLIDIQPPLATEPSANLLESATPDTYLAIDARTATASDQ